MHGGSRRGVPPDQHGVNHLDRPGANQRTLTFSSRSPWDSGTRVRWTTPPAGYGWTACCSRRPGIPRTTASSRTRWPTTATRRTARAAGGAHLPRMPDQLPGHRDVPDAGRERCRRQSASPRPPGTATRASTAELLLAARPAPRRLRAASRAGFHDHGQKWPYWSQNCPRSWFASRPVASEMVLMSSIVYTACGPSAEGKVPA